MLVRLAIATSCHFLQVLQFIKKLCISLYQIYGVRLQCYLVMVLVIIFYLWMHITDTIGFILFQTKVMLSQYLFGLKLKSKILLERKSKYFKPTMEPNISNSLLTYINKVFYTDSRVLTSQPKMVWQRGVIAMLFNLVCSFKSCIYASDLWEDAFVTSAYLINRLPLLPLNGKTPLELMFGTTPDYKALKCFGCLCYPYLRAYNSHKLENRSLPCIFIGYGSVQKGYLCYHRKTRRLYVSRHVEF